MSWIYVSLWKRLHKFHSHRTKETLKSIYLQNTLMTTSVGGPWESGKNLFYSFQMLPYSNLTLGFLESNCLLSIAIHCKFFLIVTRILVKIQML
jgi:hypothetical protein